MEAIEASDAVIARINEFRTSVASAVEEQTASTAEVVRIVAEAATGSTQIAENVTGVAAAAQTTQRGGHPSPGRRRRARPDEREPAAHRRQFRLRARRPFHGRPACHRGRGPAGSTPQPFHKRAAVSSEITRSEAPEVDGSAPILAVLRNDAEGSRTC